MDPAIRERPQRQCDIVMKGGITSGVVYPRAVREIAATYRLKSVGGTSAGAIAAAAAAAAEYGRASGGFDTLDELPGWIGAKGNLIGLFQPQKRTRRLFALLLAGIGHRRAKPLRLGLAALRSFPVTALAGTGPGVVLGVLIARGAEGTVAEAAGWIAAALVALLGLAVALVLRIRHVVGVAVPANFYGLCSGMEGHGSRRPALTPWLCDLIDRAAGRDAGPHAPPLTFGDLWSGPPGEQRQEGEEFWLRLEMMTTNVTNHRAERLPSATREYFFSPADFRRLFPERVVAWMIEHPPPLPDAPAAREGTERRREQLLPLRPMPEPADLPVIVATRMSLSFPVLLSAVPLWKIDYSLRRNQQGEPRPERCWFSDGGIASNFPVHFFDSYMPRHPTFAINLRPFHPDRAPAKGQAPSPDQSEHVWLPDRHNAGIVDWWYRFDSDLGGFLGNIVRTMQNRVDDAQMRLPGYRDRVVHVSLTAEEGGLNLDMAPEVIHALSERGRWAGRRLVERFAHPPADPKALSWEDHRWVRYRTTLNATAEMLRDVASAYAGPPPDGERSYAEILAREEGEHPSSYPLTKQQRALAERLGEQIDQLAAELAAAEAPLSDGAPQPAPALRIAPTDPPLVRRATART